MNQRIVWGCQVAKFPIGERQQIVSARMNGKPIKTFSASKVVFNNPVAPVTVEVTFSNIEPRLNLR
jgi:hypothetical protein